LEGRKEGEEDGSAEGFGVGFLLGCTDGLRLGRGVTGATVGLADGDLEGGEEGEEDGTNECSTVGALVDGGSGFRLGVVIDREADIGEREVVGSSVRKIGFLAMNVLGGELVGM
jgi:hypothetical protein